MRLSFVSLTLFLARLMALLTSDTLSMVSSNVTTLIGRLACELRLARTTQESHDSHISSGALEYFFLMALHTLSLLHFPLPHFQRPSVYVSIRDCVTLKTDLKILLSKYFRCCVTCFTTSGTNIRNISDEVIPCGGLNTGGV